MKKLSLRSHETPGNEITELKRLFVNPDKTEYAEVGPDISRKITDLLKSQEDILSHDLEALLGAADKIQGANCHKTALFLTGKYSQEQLFAHDNDDPETAGHEFIEAHSTLYKDPGELQRMLKSRKFPFRISFFKPKDGKDFAYHSLTVLGLTNAGRLVGFEKGGPYSDNVFKYIDAMREVSSYLMHGYAMGLEKDTASEQLPRAAEAAE